MNDVTIIVATYDRPAMCESALRSAIATRARVLLFDHGSPTDYAQRLAATYGVEYLRRPQEDRSAPPFDHAETTYAALLYDDDVLMKRWLSLSLGKMAEGCDVVAASYLATDAELHPTRTVRLKRANLGRLLAGLNPVNDGALIRRSVLDGVTWRTDRGTAMFYSLWLELLAKGVRFGVVEEPCWYYRRHPGQMSRTLGEDDARWRAEAIAEWRHAA